MRIQNIFANYAETYIDDGLAPLALTPFSKQPPLTRRYQTLSKAGVCREAAKWTRYKPTANIGLLLSHSNLLVVDHDTKDRKAIDRLREIFGPTDFTQLTPSGGYHDFYQANDAVKRSYNLRKKGFKADIKAGRSAYTVFAPSACPNGRYGLIGFEPSDLEEAPEISQDALDLLGIKKNEQPQEDWYREGAIPNGARHDTLLKRLTRDYKSFMPLETCTFIAWKHVQDMETPLSDKEVMEIVAYVIDQRSKGRTVDCGPGVKSRRERLADYIFANGGTPNHLELFLRLEAIHGSRLLRGEDFYFCRKHVNDNPRIAALGWSEATLQRHFQFLRDTDLVLYKRKSKKPESQFTTKHYVLKRFI